MWVACLKTFSVLMRLCKDQEKPQNVSQVWRGKAPLLTLHISACLPFYVFTNCESKSSCWRNYFQMTLWERKTHYKKAAE